MLVQSAFMHAELPREVALAVRGPDYHPPSHPRPPEVITKDADPGLAERESSAAITEAVARCTLLLDLCARTHITTLKTDGVGIREIKRIARAVAVPESGAALYIDLAFSRRLNGAEAGKLLPTQEYDAWRQLEPAPRLCALVDTWWSLRYA